MSFFNDVSAPLVEFRVFLRCCFEELSVDQLVLRVRRAHQQSTHLYPAIYFFGGAKFILFALAVTAFHLMRELLLWGP
jgi:hypothetical protein